MKDDICRLDETGRNNIYRDGHYVNVVFPSLCKLEISVNSPRYETKYNEANLYAFAIMKKNIPYLDADGERIVSVEPF